MNMFKLQIQVEIYSKMEITLYDIQSYQSLKLKNVFVINQGNFYCSFPLS